MADHSAAMPQPKELNELHGLNKLHEVEQFARAAHILTDSRTEGGERRAEEAGDHRPRGGESMGK